MGYELHITRAERRYESEEHPISLTEWQSYAAGHPALEEMGWVGWDDARVPVYGYTCTDGSVVSLTWGEGAIARARDGEERARHLEA